MSTATPSTTAFPPSTSSGLFPLTPLLKRLLARYLTALSLRPLRTKSLTAAVLFFLQEVVAHRLSGSPPPAELQRKDGWARRNLPGGVVGVLSEFGVGAKAIQMPMYGAFISAPLNHFFVGFFQKMFEGKTTPGAKIAQIIAMQLIQSPITAVVYLASMAVINGARSVAQVKQVVKMGFGNVIKSMWISSPLAIGFAQRYLPQETWVVWFNLVSFVIGTYMTTTIKKRHLIAQAKARAKREGDE